MRYSIHWVYECLLIRIKSKKTYEHLRTHKILALPSIDTLNRSIRKMDSGYGFNKSIFELLKKKSDEMTLEQRRGTLLIDEMKLSEAIAFDQKNLKMIGFTDLGKYTPLHQRSKKGDHALVMMFQPFQGRWVQVIACFLYKGCASGTILHHLVLEAILLLEKSGYFVDGIVTDSATWNRSIWNKFGVTEREVSVTHPHDDERRLWFFSDFPHLIKNLRNFIVKYDETLTPDGVLKLKHWKAILEAEDCEAYNLKIAYKLTMDHIKPKHYQKMNVTKAFQLFGEPVANAMTILKPLHKDLIDCKPTVTFINRVKKLVKAMNSRIPVNALRRNSVHWEAVNDFFKYIKKWETISDRHHFMSANTCYGFKISLKAVLELFMFLETKTNYVYLMTCRLNQDSLERFFGMMRSSCGSNDHSDSILFMQIFKLMSTYSLVKTPRGSNIDGKEMLEKLMSLEDVSKVASVERKNAWEKILNNILDNETQCDSMVEVIQKDPKSSDFIMAYMAGYVSRKSKRFSKCASCETTLNGHIQAPMDELIRIRSEGNLQTASNELVNLISTIKTVIISIIENNDLNAKTFSQISSSLEELDGLPLVGCPSQNHQLTQAIINFYIISRLHMICKRSNTITDNVVKEKTKAHRKSAKY